MDAVSQTITAGRDTSSREAYLTYVTPNLFRVTDLTKTEFFGYVHRFEDPVNGSWHEGHDADGTVYSYTTKGALYAADLMVGRLRREQQRKESTNAA